MSWQAIHERIQTPGRRVWICAAGAGRANLFRRAAQGARHPTGWLPAHGGLIANLRVWENCILPRSYFGARPGEGDDRLAADLLDRLDLSLEAGQALMAAKVHSLTGYQYGVVSALRTLMSRPALIMVECEWFAHFEQDEAIRLARLFDAECSNATWLAIGRLPPPALWGTFEQMECADEAVA